jgi:3'-phosphoadenosine 5'-phosphosulfate sulfotransferase (PAPS reductase)/FAD synthetase
MKVISLGWGCQSFALAAMSALGILPKVDAAIHADTTHERRETYEFAKRWTPWLEERGMKVVTLRGTRTDLLKLMPNGPSIPARTTYADGRISGFLRRQCTYEWKILPIRNWVHHQDKGLSEMWMGITLDEVTRMRVSDKAYIRNVYPFVESLDRPWTRGMVMQ